MISGIVRQLESQTEGDITSDQIGKLVMEGLKQVDEVAYVRFASVYKDFQEAKDFEGFLSKMEEDEWCSDIRYERKPQKIRTIFQYLNYDIQVEGKFPFSGSGLNDLQLAGWEQFYNFHGPHA